MNNENDDSRTLNDKYFECRVDCPGNDNNNTLNSPIRNYSQIKEKMI